MPKPLALHSISNVLSKLSKTSNGALINSFNGAVMIQKKTFINLLSKLANPLKLQISLAFFYIGPSLIALTFSSSTTAQFLPIMKPKKLTFFYAKTVLIKISIKFMFFLV